MPLPLETLHPVCRLSAAVCGQIERWVLAAYPLEACGLLIGTRRPHDGGSDAVAAFGARNRNRERPGDRYELDPSDHLAVSEGAAG